MSDVNPTPESEVQEGGWPPGWVSSGEEQPETPDEGDPEQ